MHWQITTLDTPTSFTGLGNFKTQTVASELPLLVADSGQVLAIPGLIGGQTSKTDDHSLDLILEVANFEAEMICRSSSSLNYRSEASRIWAGAVKAPLRELFQIHLVEILELWQKETGENVQTKTELEFGGPITNQSGASILGAKSWQLTTLLQWSRSNFETLETGLKIDFAYLSQRLDGQSADFWRPILIEKMNLVGYFEPESQVWFGNIYYGHITTLEKLLIELTRLIGFDKLRPQFLTVSTDLTSQSRLESLLGHIKKLATQSGFTEVITRPFINEQAASLAKIPAERVLNPYNANLPFLRNWLLPSLLNVLTENLTRGFKNPAIFESNQIYTSAKQRQILAVMAMLPTPYLLTTFIHQLTVHLGFAPHLTQFRKLSSDQTTRLGQTTVYQLHKVKKLTGEATDDSTGEFTLIQISNRLKKDWGLPLGKTLWYLEIEINPNWQFDPLPAYFDESEFPSITRDYSLETALSWQEIHQTIQSLPRSFDLRVWPIERFKPTKTDQSLLSKNQTAQILDKLTFKVKFQSSTQTLTKTQVDQWEELLLPKLNS